MNPAGTLWQVIDGYARGFVSEYIFLRTHSWNNTGRILQVQNLQAFIAERPPFDASVLLIRNPAGTVCFYEDNIKRLITNQISFTSTYHFDASKITNVSENVFDAIPTGSLLPEPSPLIEKAVVK